MLFTVATAFAQKINVQGKIIDNTTKTSVIGANIYVKQNKQIGVISDVNGRFTLENVEKGSDLVISMIGYQTVSIKATTTVEVFLKQDISNLSEVIVSTSRTQKKREVIPVAVSTISTRAIDEVKPETVDQVLNQTAGVLMVDLGNEQHMMAIRQPISTKSLFLYLEDGVPIRPSGVFNHNALLEMNMVASGNIEVIRGPFSSLYGSDAVGGAINFITKNPSSIPKGSFSVRRHNNGYLRMDVSASGKIGKLGVYVGGYKSQIKNGIRQYGDYDKDAITTKITYDFSDKTNWSNTLTYINYFSEMSGSLDDEKFRNRDYSSFHTFTYRDAKALRFNSTFQHSWNDAQNSSLSLVYRDNSMKQNPSYRISNRTKPGEYTKGQVNENSFNSYAFVGQHNISLDKLKLNFGANLDYSPNTYEAFETSVFRNADGFFESFSLTGKTLANYNVDIFNLGGYAMAEYQLSDVLLVSGALRVEQFNYDFSPRLDNASDYKAPKTKRSFTSYTPRLGAIYKVSDDFRFYGNYSNGFLPPSVGELFRKADVPLLDPSKFSNYEVGSFFHLFDNKVYADLAVYYLNGKDEIASVTALVNNDEVRENRNVGKSEHYGVEYMFKITPVEQLNVRFSGSYAKHKYIDFVTKVVNDDITDFSGKEMKVAPNWVNNAQLQYRPNFLKGLRASLEWQHVGNYFTDDANTKEYGGYDVFNARLGYKKNHIHVWANLINAFDKLYATRAAYRYGRTTYSVGNPRTLTLGLEINLF